MEMEIDFATIGKDGKDDSRTVIALSRSEPSPEAPVIEL
jgi:hypothetical protein